MQAISAEDVVAGCASLGIVAGIATFINKLTFGAIDKRINAVDERLISTDIHVKALENTYVRRPEWEQSNRDFWNAISQTAKDAEARHNRLLDRIQESDRTILAALMNNRGHRDD